ncbi:MAG: hydroxymethylpyrimidine/phosphomethylpyrimidine kinase [Deltaproteobacteria bacterium]|nr:hydroxymethylpyrimidine/phosphomethylpyrimidine kinase [Deltaproteobacteria bacterium]
MTPYRGPAKTAAPDLLICSGLDPSGGAGLIADVRVTSELGARPNGVVTALTVQNTTGVVNCQACDPEIVGDQLAFLMTDIEVRAVKIGMIGSTPIAKAIANALHLTSAPVVWDPILYPSRGDIALTDSLFADAMLALRPHLTVVTPNARELAYMTNLPVTDLASAEAAGRALAARLDCAVLVKGGHLATDESVDVLITTTSRDELRTARIPSGEHVHGTGCALSSAIAAHLAHGRELLDAVTLAKDYVREHIASPAHPGRGAPAAL